MHITVCLKLFFTQLIDIKLKALVASVPTNYLQGQPSRLATCKSLEILHFLCAAYHLHTSFVRKPYSILVQVYGFLCLVNCTLN